MELLLEEGEGNRAELRLALMIPDETEPLYFFANDGIGIGLRVEGQHSLLKRWKECLLQRAARGDTGRETKGHVGVKRLYVQISVSWWGCGFVTCMTIRSGHVGTKNLLGPDCGAGGRKLLVPVSTLVCKFAKP